MNLKEFIDSYYNRKDKSTCPVCNKKVDPDAKDTVSDHDGNLYHKACFDKAVGNDELKKRRTDNQLPYED